MAARGGLRVNGTRSVRATIRCSADTVGAQLIVQVKARAIFPNCPRYIPELALTAASVYAPAAGHTPPEPKWKAFADFADCVPPRRPTATGEG